MHSARPGHHEHGCTYALHDAITGEDDRRRRVEDVPLQDLPRVYIIRPAAEGWWTYAQRAVASCRARSAAPHFVIGVRSLCTAFHGYTCRFAMLRRDRLHPQMKGIMCVRAQLSD